MNIIGKAIIICDVVTSLMSALIAASDLRFSTIALAGVVCAMALASLFAQLAIANLERGRP